MKRFFSNLGTFFSKITWFLRRKYNQLKSVVTSYLGQAFSVVTKKDLRRAKKVIQQDYIKDFYDIKDYNIDIRFDLNLDEKRLEIDSEREQIKSDSKATNEQLLTLKETDLKAFEAIEELQKKENTRLNVIFEERLILAVELEKKIRNIEFEKEKQIRKISVDKNVYEDEIEVIATESSKKIDALRREYYQASKESALNNKPFEAQTDLTKFLLRGIRVEKAKKCLPESRRSREIKDKARQIAKNTLQALLYLTPVLIFLSIFTFYPIINALRLVVYENYDDRTGIYSGFTLFGNFKKVLTDANFIVPGKYVKSSAMINTLLIVGITVPVTIAISLLISVFLNSIKPLSNLFQTVFFLPYITNTIAVGLIFAYMFQTDGGLFNRFLEIFNIDGGRWVQHGAPYWKAMFVLMLFATWNGLAFKIMVFLSAIQGIDKQYYQAASIDATPRFKQFRRITAPLISPTILYIVITSVIGAFKTYSSVIAIFGNRGRPPGADYHLKTIVFYIYDYFDHSGKMPEAAAASIVLFGIILVMTLFQMQVSKKRVHY
ncbi:MAG: ABC transporter permease subunit [Acholeplasmataceae bacterium]|jgi:multiple sugar transport system permease protein|nr:ABC transporter permease subunit [Acholeplasmataceae bacterium]